MLDLALFLFVGFLLLAGLRRPFVWVLAYLYIDILGPQKIGWALTPLFPISLIAFCAAFAGWILTDSKKGSRFTLRQAIMLALLVYCAWTTMNADFPVEAQVKWDWVWKALVFAIFLPLTLTTRLRIEGAALVMVLTAGAIIISAGLKTALGGGGYESLYFFVNDNSGMYESSTLSTVAIAIIPLILWFTRHGTVFAPDWRVKWFAYALVFACLLVPIGTEARTGLVALGVLGLLALRDVKRRFAFLFAGAALVMVAAPFLPQSYYERMGLIAGHEEDQSASTRVAVWTWTLDYAAENPMGGGFDAYRGNSFKYRMPVKQGSDGSVAVEYVDVIDEARAYHSAVFEMLGEQGWPGLPLWLWLHALGLWQMERIRRGWRGRTDAREQWQAPLASALQLAHVVYLVGSLFQGIAYQPFVLMLVGLQIALWSRCRQADSRSRPRRRARAPRDAVAARSPALR
jgi:probable O-glycosylation ligase (exosortase A-associated)